MTESDNRTDIILAEKATHNEYTILRHICMKHTKKVKNILYKDDFIMLQVIS